MIYRSFDWIYCSNDKLIEMSSYVGFSIFFFSFFSVFSVFSFFSFCSFSIGLIGCGDTIGDIIGFGDTFCVDGIFVRG